MALNHQHKTCDFCYISNILTVGSEPVISFFNKGDFFTEFALFIFYSICNEQNLVSACAFGKKTQKRFKEVYHE